MEEENKTRTFFFCVLFQINFETMMSDDKLNSSLSIKRSEVCRICGASSKCSYYGVISCSSCKTFFRRNAHVGEIFFEIYFELHFPMDLFRKHSNVLGIVTVTSI